MDEAKRIYCDLVEELPDGLEELGVEADTDEDECSRCGSIKVRYRLETTDVHIGAPYGFQWQW